MDLNKMSRKEVAHTDFFIEKNKSECNIVGNNGLSGIELVIAMVENFEFDPVAINGFVNRLEKLAQNNGGVVTLENIIKTPKCQMNSFRGNIVQKDSCNILFALTQSAKTLLTMVIAWKAGIVSKRPSILLSFNRTDERSRFERTVVSQLEKRIKLCCKYARVRYEQIPTLKITGDDQSKGGEQFIEDNVNFFIGKMPSSQVNPEYESESKKSKKSTKKKSKTKKFYEVPPVPVYIALTNSARVKNLRKLVSHMSEHLMDAGGCQKDVILILEEGDQSIKGEKSKLANVLNSTPKDGHLKIKSVKNRIHSHDESVIPEKDYIKKNGKTMFPLIDVFTTLVYVTATPQIFEKMEVHGGREVNIIRAAPSVNYWSFFNVGSCKRIHFESASSPQDMIDHMNKSAEDGLRGNALVAINGHAGTLRIENQKIFAREAALKNSNIVAIAWDGDGVHVYTQRKDWARELYESGLITLNKGEIQKKLNYKNKEIPFFWSFSGTNNKKCDEYDSEKKELNYICSYLGLITFMSKHAERVERKNGKPASTVLYAWNMVGRSTPIKSYEHEWGLTDLYLVSNGLHDEALQQLAGRLSTIDLNPEYSPRFRGKTFWSSIEERLNLQKSFSRLSKLLKIISKNETSESLFYEMREALQKYRSKNERRSKTFSDLNGVINLSKVNTTRKIFPEVEKKKFLSEVKNSKCCFVDRSRPSKIFMDCDISDEVPFIPEERVHATIAKEKINEHFSGNKRRRDESEEIEYVKRKKVSISPAEKREKLVPIIKEYLKSCNDKKSTRNDLNKFLLKNHPDVVDSVCQKRKIDNYIYSIGDKPGGKNYLEIYGVSSITLNGSPGYTL